MCSTECHSSYYYYYYYVSCLLGDIIVASVVATIWCCIKHHNEHADNAYHWVASCHCGLLIRFTPSSPSTQPPHRISSRRHWDAASLPYWITVTTRQIHNSPLNHPFRAAPVPATGVTMPPASVINTSHSPTARRPPRSALKPGEQCSAQLTHWADYSNLHNEIPTLIKGN